MIQRQLLNELEAWSHRNSHKPLVLRGARQVGKTTLVDELGKQYDVYIKLNLELSADALVFSISDDVEEIFQYLCIDEIQSEPKAVELLRYFYEKMPWLYIIAAGSRLHTLLKQRISFPVGRVEYLSLRPCSFLEYLNAIGQEPLADMIRERKVSDIYHELLINHFNRYTLIGGMPEVLAQ